MFLLRDKPGVLCCIWKGFVCYWTPRVPMGSQVLSLVDRVLALGSYRNVDMLSRRTLVIGLHSVRPTFCQKANDNDYSVPATW